MNARIVVATGLAGLFLAGCQAKKKPSVLSGILDTLTPGIALGVPAGPLADSLHFRPVAMVGYGDSTYRTPFGFRGIQLYTGDGSGSEPPTDPKAPVTAIVASIPAGPTANRAITFLNKRCGKSEKWCQLGANGRNVAMLYWPYDSIRGIALRLEFDTTGTSELTIGAPRIDPNYFSQGRCTAPGALPLDTAPPPPQ